MPLHPPHGWFSRADRQSASALHIRGVSTDSTVIVNINFLDVSMYRQLRYVVILLLHLFHCYLAFTLDCTPRFLATDQVEGESNKLMQSKQNGTANFVLTSDVHLRCRAVSSQDVYRVKLQQGASRLSVLSRNN